MAEKNEDVRIRAEERNPTICFLKNLTFSFMMIIFYLISSRY